jgi:hypothetical protein
MNPQSRKTRDAFRVLERRLAARRLAALDGRMRVLIGLLFAYAVAVAYWQARVPLDGIRRAKGEPAAAWTLAAILAAVALLGAIVAAWRRASFAERVPGPEWLALPVPPESVRRHLAAEARLPALATFPVAIAVLVAGIGLVTPAHLAALATGHALLWWLLTRLAAGLTAQTTGARVPASRGLPAAVREVIATNPRSAAGAHRSPRWRAEPAWRAIVRLDGLVSRRRSAARTRAASAALWFAAGGAAWFAAAPPLTRRALAYAAFAGGAASLGAWAIARACGDPPSALRPLPLRVRDPWRARATSVAIALALASALAALLAGSLPPLARVGLVLTFLPSGLAIAILGVNYGITLAPRATIAEYLFYGWLVVALIASWMIPFLGWGVLLFAVAHSSLRLARAARPADA